jgi:hypothetical protein
VSDALALLRRHERMKSQRQTSVETVWRDCFDYTFPLRGNGLAGAIETANSGQAKQAQLLDNTAGDSANVLASNIMAGLTPANALWFALDVGNETDEERRWLDESAELLWENIHMGNFDAEAFEGCLDIVSAGMFALFIDEERERGGLVFHQWPLASIYVGSTRADGRVDIVHREYTLTAEQAVGEFGEKNVPETIRKAFNTGKPDEEFKFVQAIYPRTPHAVGAKLAKNLPFASCHLELASKKLVRESGYHEMPVIVPRWLRVPGSLYAIGPMYTALPAARQLNELKAIELAGADIAVSGMWLGIDDGVLNPRTVKLGPRKIVIAADKDSLTPLQTGANFELSELMVAKLQADIRKILMADQLQPQDGPQMTATEVHVRVEMIRKLLGPIYGRLQAEYLKPLVERCFGLAYRAGIFKPAPESLRGRSFSVRYVSPLARAQKLDEVMAIESVFASAAQLEAVAPGTMDNLDPQKALELIVEGRGAPQAIRRSPEDVEKLRASKAAQQKQQMAEAGAMEAQQAGMQQAAVRAAGGR